MNKLKLFVENFFVYGIGGVVSKLIPLIMLPIITRLMPDSAYFGINDLSNTIIQFGYALAIMGMYDAMYRMFFEEEGIEYRTTVCSTALTFTCCTSLAVFLIMIAGKNVIARYFFREPQYSYVVYLSAVATLVGATNSIVSAPTIMQNKRIIYVLANTVGPILSYAISVPMILAGHYVVALPVAAIVSGATVEFGFWVINRKWFRFGCFDLKILKQMLIVAIPLVPNFLIYWVFGSCDRIMITNMIGLDEAGIYAVGSKLGHCSQLIYMAFSGGWQFFAFSTMKENDQVKTNSLVFEYLGLISFAATAFICALSYPIYDFLFADEYLSGYIVAPYLFAAPLLQMLFQIAVNQFLVIKKTWPNMFILSAGAIANIIINFFLIPVIGIEGAAIATMMGYVLSDIICIVVLCKMKLMVISGKFILSSLIMIGFMISWRMFFNNQTLHGLIAALSFVIVLALIYGENIRQFLQAVRRRDNR